MANFMDLPREIRDQIYKLLLTVGVEIVAHPTYFEKLTKFRAKGVIRPAVALLRVNKQIGGEAAIVLYGDNTWRIPDPDRFESEIYEKYGNLFRHVTIHLDRRDIDTQITTRSVVRAHERLAPSTMDERMKRIHNDRLKYLGHLIYLKGLAAGYMTCIQSLTLVLDNLYCPGGCCRFDIIKKLYQTILHKFDPNPRHKSRRITRIQSLKDVRVTGLIFQAERDLVYGKWGFQGAAVEEGTA